jgi:hypothetical protein
MLYRVGEFDHPCLTPKLSSTISEDLPSPKFFLGFVPTYILLKALTTF